MTAATTPTTAALLRELRSSRTLPRRADEINRELRSRGVNVPTTWAGIDFALALAAHPDGRALTPAQTQALAAKSTGECQRCGKTAPLYRLHTQGADPTTWLLCGICHPQPDAGSIEINEDYLHFLADPAGPTYEEHQRAMHEEEPWGPLDTLMGDAPEQDAEPELERLRRLPTTQQLNPGWLQPHHEQMHPQREACPNCGRPNMPARCPSCLTERLA